MDFATWLTNELRKRGWSEAHLAKLAGVTRSAINNVTRGIRNPGIDMCNGIARAFEVSPESILRRANLLPKVAPGDVLDAEILHLADKMTDQEKDELRDYAELLLARRKKIVEHNI